MVKKIFIAGILFMVSAITFPFSASAATINAASCSQADVQSAVNSSANGDTVMVPAGNCAWSSGVTLYNAKGVSVIGAGVGLTNITVNTTGQVFSIDTIMGVNNNLYRISGFTFTTSLSGGIPIWFYGYRQTAILGNFRIDHNTFNNFQEGIAILLGETTSKNDFYGVIDHNTFTGPVNFRAMELLGPGNTTPWRVSPKGTLNNLFLEDNVWDFASINATSAGAGCIDGWMSGSLVFRHNTIKNCLVTSHGEDHGGGIISFEVYDNLFQRTSGSGGFWEDGTRLFHHQGSGETMFFNNRFSVPSTKSTGVIGMTYYRAASAAEAVYDSSEGRCNGTSAEDGNRSPSTTYGYPCFEQPGRTGGGAVKSIGQPGTLSPMYVWNNRWVDTGAKVDMVIEDPWSGPPYPSNLIVANRDYYNAVSPSEQTSPTSPFNGTTGMGFGTLANRPTTCTTNTAEAGGGVGYWATDTNTLYRCDPGNSWVTQYVPYTYPHPLASGTVPPPDTIAPSNPTGLSASVVSSSVNLSWTASTDNVGVTGYRVERCTGSGCTTFTQIGTPTATAYSDTGLSATTAYTYRVRAIDAAGNLSGYSNEASVVTPDIPVTPDSGYIQGGWSTDNTTATSISQVFSGSNTAGNAIVVAVSWDTDATPVCSDSQGNTYSVITHTYDTVNAQAFAVCYALNIKAGANTVTVGFGGSHSWRRLLIHEYTGITGVDVTATNIANGTTAANNITSTAGVTTANGNLIFGVSGADSGTTTIAPGTGFTERVDNGLHVASQDTIQTTAGSIASTQTYGTATRYLAHMVAFKRGGVVTPPSTKFVLNDRIQVSSGPVDVRATANTTGTLLGTQATNALGTVVGGPTAQGGFNWWNINYDAGADGWSKEDFLVKYTPPAADTTAPTVPTNLTATSTSSSQINLTWTPSTDAVGVTGYKIFRGGIQIGTSVSNSYSDTGLTASTLYSYTVSAYDAAGNNSAQSTSASATTAGASPSATITMGETSIFSSDDSGNANLLLAQDTTLSQTATLQSLSFYVTAASGNLRLGVYDATGPNAGPGKLKAQTNSFTPVVGWNTVNVITPVSLVAGKYWLAYLPSSSNLHFAASFTTGKYKYYSYTFGTMPATFSTKPKQGTTHWSFYATLNTGVASGPLTRQLAKGSTGNDVSLLQKFLATFDHVYPEKIISGYYGSLTANAISAFQNVHGIPSVGRVGPMTLKKINELMGL